MTYISQWTGLVIGGLQCRDLKPMPLKFLNVPPHSLPKGFYILERITVRKINIRKIISIAFIFTLYLSIHSLSRNHYSFVNLGIRQCIFQQVKESDPGLVGPFPCVSVNPIDEQTFHSSTRVDIPSPSLLYSEDVHLSLLYKNPRSVWPQTSLPSDIDRSLPVA